MTAEHPAKARVMRKAIKAAISGLVMGVALLLAPSVSALCELSKPSHTTDCAHDEYGMCCVSESYFHDQTCFDVWCMTFESCVWELGAEQLCS